MVDDLIDMDLSELTANLSKVNSAIVCVEGFEHHVDILGFLTNHPEVEYS